MAIFNCISDGITLKTFDLNQVTREYALKTCVALKTEFAGTADGGQSAERASGLPAYFAGKWTDVDKTITEVYKSAPESRQRIKYSPMPDRWAHDLLLESYTQRMDYIWQRASELDADDKNRLTEKLFRDLTATVRALMGDIYDLQERLGELMIRVDSLENWDKVYEENPGGFDDLEGINIPHFEPHPNHPPYPHTHGLHKVSDREEDKAFHQGFAVLWKPSYQVDESPGIKRYLNAQKQAQVPMPDNSPQEEFEEGRRYNQGRLDGKGKKP